jgi:hypothetical protein
VFDFGAWSKTAPLLIWITGIVGAWIGLLLGAIRSLLKRSVQQIDDQFLELRKRLESLEASLGGTNQKVTNLELKLQQEISKLKEEILGGYLRKDEWLREEHRRDAAARRLSRRLEVLEELVRLTRPVQLLAGCEHACPLLPPVSPSVSPSASSGASPVMPAPQPPITPDASTADASLSTPLPGTQKGA